MQNAVSIEYSINNHTICCFVIEICVESATTGYTRIWYNIRDTEIA